MLFAGTAWEVLHVRIHSQWSEWHFLRNGYERVETPYGEGFVIEDLKSAVSLLDNHHWKEVHAA